MLSEINTNYLRCYSQKIQILVIEAGHSVSLEGLRRDVTRWFSASAHQVKDVLLAMLEESRGEIILEKWKEVSAPLSPNRRPLANITRAPGSINTDSNRFNPTSCIVH